MPVDLSASIASLNLLLGIGFLIMLFLSIGCHSVSLSSSDSKSLPESSNDVQGSFLSRNAGAASSELLSFSSSESLSESPDASWRSRGE